MSTTRPNGVAVIGSITADVTAFSQRLPRRGETVLGQDATLVLGGKGANQALAAARAGAPTWMIGCVGTDMFRTLTLEGLNESGVNTDQVRTVAGPTGLAHIRVDVLSGQNDIVMTPLANDHLSTEQAIAALDLLTDKVSVLLLQLETPVDMMTQVATKAHRKAITVILDPAPAQPLPEDSWASLDIITPNETEASLLSGIEVTDADSAKQAARVLRAKGVGTVIVTMAQAGAVVADDEGEYLVAPFHVEPIDTTAAGDAFTGVLGQSLAAGLPLEQALTRSSAAGALATTVRGASPSLPTAQSLSIFLEQNK